MNERFSYMSSCRMHSMTDEQQFESQFWKSSGDRFAKLQKVRYKFLNTKVSEPPRSKVIHFQGSVEVHSSLLVLGLVCSKDQLVLAPFPNSSHQT